jgi:diguanylate cyclase (GGDEF) domain
MKRIEDILKAISEVEECLTIEEALWKIASLALILFDAKSATIIDVSNKPYHFVVLKNIDNRAAIEFEEALRKGIDGKNLEIVKNSKKPLILDDTFKYDFWLKVGNSPRSWIGIPIMAENEVRYILNIDNYEPFYYNESHMELAGIFSKYTTEAINKIGLIEQFFKTATIDKLTEVETRQQLFDILEKNIDRYKRYNARFTCLMLDLDKFKYINDTFGHDVGDTALKSFAKVLKENLRQSDYAFRYGGDEFIIKLEEASENEGLSIAKRLKELISNIEIDGGFKLSTSIGIKEYKGEQLEEFLKKLDIALYEAKKSKEGIVLG